MDHLTNLLNDLQEKSRHLPFVATPFLTSKFAELVMNLKFELPISIFASIFVTSLSYCELDRKRDLNRQVIGQTLEIVRRLATESDDSVMDEEAVKVVYRLMKEVVSAVQGRDMRILDEQPLPAPPVAVYPQLPPTPSHPIQPQAPTPPPAPFSDYIPSSLPASLTEPILTDSSAPPLFALLSSLPSSPSSLLLTRFPLNPDPAPLLITSNGLVPQPSASFPHLTLTPHHFLSYPKCLTLPSKLSQKDQDRTFQFANDMDGHPRMVQLEKRLVGEGIGGDEREKRKKVELQSIVKSAIAESKPMEFVGGFEPRQPEAAKRAWERARRYGIEPVYSSAKQQAETLKAGGESREREKSVTTAVEGSKVVEAVEVNDKEIEVLPAKEAGEGSILGSDRKGKRKAIDEASAEVEAEAVQRDEADQIRARSKELRQYCNSSTTLASTSSESNLVRVDPIPTIYISAPDSAASPLVSGPRTSTPAFALAHAPAPAPTRAEAHSIAPFGLVKKSVSEPAPLSRRQSNATAALPDPALFASTTTLAEPAPKRKKTREEWDGISRDTPEEIRVKKKGKGEEAEVTVEESMPLSPTQVHEDEEEEDLDMSMALEERDPALKRTAEQTVDTDLDEGDSHSYSVAVEEHGGGPLDTSTVNGDDSYRRRNLSPRPTNSGDPMDESLDDQGPPRNQVTLPLFNQVASSSSASSSPMASQDHHAQFDSSAQDEQQQAQSKRLSDISEMKSSQELPPTQYEVEATQKVYDAEKSQMSIRSGDIDITNSTTWHAPFAHGESTSTSHSRQRSNPIPGRELRRVPPPPTPAVDPPPPRASSPLKQSFQASESTQPANDSSPAPNLPETSSSNPPQPEDSLALPIPPSHHAKPPTQPIQPTQEVAESSPDIPLSKRARLEKGASEATSRSSLRRASPLPTRQQQTTQSSNGKVVPDSAGPTQPEPEEEEENEEVQRQPVASTSARNDGSDSEDEIGSLTSLEDMMKASGRKSRAKSAENEKVVETPKDRKGKGKAKEEEEDGVAKRKSKLKEMKGRILEENDGEEEEEVSERLEKKSKGEEKAKVAVKEKGGASKGKGKGKKKVVEVESESELSSPEEVEETNYSDMPKARNTKKPSPKKKQSKAAVVDQSSARKPRRKASGPPIIERSDDEEMEEEKEQQNRPAKPATSTKRKRQPSPRPNDNVTASAKRSKRSLSTGAVTSSKKVVVSKGRRSTTGSSRVNPASNSPEPHQPVAGPSRLRFDLEPEEDARTETSDTKPSLGSGSKLPPSAPFSRCFGLWRDDGYYYSGTIESVAREHFNVKFDDGNTGKLRSNEIRRCELEKGDYVLYFGNEVETETQAQSYTSEFRVSKISRNGDEEEEEGAPLEAQDAIIVEEAADYDSNRARTQRFLIEAIRISPLRSHQFNNRKLTLDELDSFEGKVRSNAKPLPVIPPPTRPDTSAFEDNDKKNWGLFGRMAFLVTYASSKSPSEPNLKELKPVDRERFLDKLKDNGATIIDWEHLFEAGIDQRTKNPQVLFPPTDFNGIDTILLLADRPTTTMKFLIALALGIPCCSLEFAGASIKAGTRLDWKDWLLPSGYIQSMKTSGIGGQLRALLKSFYDLSSLERSQQGEGVFKNQSFLVIMEKQGKSREEVSKVIDETLSIEFDSSQKLTKLSLSSPQSFTENVLYAYMLLSLLSCCSASRIDFLPLPLPPSSPFVQSPSEFLNSAQSYTHVFLDFDQSNSTMEAAVKGLVNGHKGVVNMNWVKQCLMAGRLLSSERIKVQD